MTAKSTRQFAAEQGNRLLAAVSVSASRAAKSAGTDEVHDLRVAIRRYRRILHVLKPCFPRWETKQIRRSLKGVIALAGSVRDHDIGMRLFGKMAVAGSASEQSDEIPRQLQERRDGAAWALSAALKSWIRENLAADWRSAVKSETGARGADARFCAASPEIAARTILPAMAKEHFQAGEKAASEGASLDKLHKFRIAARNLRYTLDAFEPLYGESLADLLDRLKEVQDLLGEIHDCAVVSEMLSREKEGDKTRRKEVIAELKKRQRKKTKEFRKQFSAEFSSAAALRQWREKLQETNGGGQLRSGRRKTKAV